MFKTFISILLFCSLPVLALNTNVNLPSASDYSSSILKEHSGIVPWKTLAEVKFVKKDNVISQEFSKNILDLDNTETMIQGFMIPLDMGDKQQHFLITAVPAHCQFCLPAGPEAIVEVNASYPVSYSFEPIILIGKFIIVKNDSSGVLYRMSNAKKVELIYNNLGIME